ncbi:hypothetical protein [Microbacterium sp. H83]|uniref:hypothetical protein n=1 Tax=Microbacterium sp. H83 TaxID=1827324 RepID=UPI0007F3B6CC|nr:hypothetical protein [Microbacterium sp. H83]OAN33050.1 hypothetical protein A4X16_07550 [Microbacterium sp. H83]
MFVSAEIIAIVLSAVGIVVTLAVAMFAGFSWCVRRTDGLETKLSSCIDGVEAKLSARIDAVASDLSEVEKSLVARIDAVASDLSEVERSLVARIDAVAADTTDLKIAMARIEGPQRHLVVASR